MRLYLAAPARHAADLLDAVDLLAGHGHALSWATPVAGLDVDDLVAAVGADLDAVGSSDALVTIGDCADLPEILTAELSDVPVFTLAEFAAVAW
jgi:hypothetical protein